MRRMRYLNFKKFRDDWAGIGKMAAMILLTAFLTSMAYAYGQTITLSEKNISLSELLKKISKQSNLDLIGDLSILNDKQVVTINVKDQDLGVVLKQLSDMTNTHVELYKNTIILKAKTSNPAQNRPVTTEASLQQTYELKGKVVNQSGSPLVRATIRTIDGRHQTTSNEQGEFMLRISPNTGLLVSMIGYVTKEVEITQQATVMIILSQEVNVIEETVITGYTNIRKESFTGAAKVITRKDLEKVNNNNIFSVLQALDPSFKVDEGVEIGSDPNAIPEINIRGISSVGAYAVNAPLVILDGFEVQIQTLYDIDINRIESIALLKDASSTSMYGSRGGNGVIVIETRLPKEGKFTVTYDARPSVTMVDLSDYNLMNAAEKLEYEKLAGIYRSTTTDISWGHIEQEMYDNLQAARQNNVLSGVDTYWLNQPVQSTFSIGHSLRMEGGRDEVRYSLEGNYNDYKGVMKESGRIRGGAGFNLIYRIPNRITFRNNATYLYTHAYNSPYGNFSTYTELNPYERIFDENGNYQIRFSELGNYTFGPVMFNPLHNAELSAINGTHEHLISNNTSLEWFINQNFRMTARAILSRSIANQEVYKSPFHTDYYNVTDRALRGSYLLGNEKDMQIDGNLNLQYSNNFGQHQIVSNVVGEVRSSENTGHSHRLIGFIDDNLISPSLAIQYEPNKLPTTISIPKRSVGLLGSLYYTFANRYNLSATFRTDGSSIYGKENRYGNFWSTGVSYNVHNESWFQSKLVNRWRLRANIGTNGTEGFNADMIHTSFRYAAGNYYYKQFASLYSGQGNQSIKWPQIKQISLGTEIGLFGDLLSIDYSYYDRVTNDMISPITVAPSFGFFGSTFVQNLGKVSNRGFEVSANIRLLEMKDQEMAWYLTFGAVRNKSKLLEISNELRQLNESLVVTDGSNNVIKPSNYYEEGQSLSIIRAVPSLGIDPASGREMFRTLAGDVSYTWDAANQVVVGDREADLFGNINTSFSFRRLTVQVYGSYSIGGDLFNETLMNKIENNSPYKNADRRILEQRWQQPGDQVLYKAIDDLTVTQISSRFVQEENYFRLMSINVNYDLPLTVIQRYRLQRARVNFSTNDVFRVSTVRMERGILYPYARTYNFGLMIQF